MDEGKDKKVIDQGSVTKYSRDVFELNFRKVIFYRTPNKTILKFKEWEELTSPVLPLLFILSRHLYEDRNLALLSSFNIL